MPLPTNQPESEGILVRRCQEGDQKALAELHEKFNGPLGNILASRGATASETQDLLGDIWADCVPGNDERPSLLEKFSGKCTLLGWLATVLTNRWINFRRRQKRLMEIPEADTASVWRRDSEVLSITLSAGSEGALMELLLESLRSAFAACDPEALVSLRLIYCHGLTQREVMRLLSWSESKVSRFLSQALEQLKEHTLRELKKRDPWLMLSWDDLEGLCETYEIGFL